MNKFLKSVAIVTLLIFLRVGFALAADQVYFYYTDPAGTPLAMSDAAGAVIWKADYMPFGEEMIGQSTVPNNKMFVGKEKDSESGLYYFGARYMDSPAGRFVSPDPVGAVDPQTGEVNQLILHDPQRLNGYAYGLNNPYKYIDKDGKMALAEVLVGVALVVMTIALLAARQQASLQKQKTKSKTYSSSSESSTNNSNDEEPENKGSQGNKDTQKEVKRFSKRSLKDQLKEYRHLKKTYEQHLQQYDQEAGKTSGETNRIERQLQEYRNVLQQRGQQFTSTGGLIE